MAKQSAGLLLYRRRDAGWEVFLVHPGGPFWAKKDQHAWSIPKGELDDREDPLAAAKREFVEETGLAVPDGPFQALPPLKTSGGKIVHAFVVAADADAETVVSNTFEIEWPPRSGRRRAFPEVDRAAWVDLETARTKLHKGQAGLVDALIDVLADE